MSENREREEEKDRGKENASDDHVFFLIIIIAMKSWADIYGP